MLVQYETHHYKSDHEWLWKRGDIERVELVSVDFCCEEMKDAFEQKFVGFGEYDSVLNKDKNVNIYRCFPYTEGAAWDEFPINYCPFCAKAITITEKSPHSEE